MNKFTLLYQKALIMLSLMLTGYASQAQTQIFLEKMGTVTSNTSVAAHETADGFDNDAFTMTVDGAAAGNSADIRKSNNIGTDGTDDANVYFTASGDRNFAIEGIDASGYTNLELEFAYRKESASALPDIELAFWDGTAYVPVTYTFAEAANATTGWYTVSGIQLPAAAQVNDLKLRWKKTAASVAARLDEVKLTGTAAAPVVNPTIASTLNGRTGVVVGVQEAYDVTTTAGSMAGDMVKVKATLADPTQASDMTLEYLEVNDGLWYPLTFDANGVLMFGPATGFPLANATSSFRVTYNAAGTYTTLLEIVDAATGVAIVPGTTESVTVAAPVVAPTIASTLNGRTGVVVGVQEAYDVTTTAGSMAGDMVKVKATLADPTQAADMTLEYLEVNDGLWYPLTFDANGVLMFGPATGFPLANATSSFRVTYNAAGTYTTLMEIVDAATGIAIVPGTTESVTVAAPVVAPTISSDLAGRTGVKTTVEENFAVSTTTGTHANHMVKVKMALVTPAQAADITLLYEATPGNFLPLTFNAAGEVEFGPATGFPLANTATNFKVTFAAAGTYDYTLAIVDATTGTALATPTAESVTVAAFVNPTIASTLNGRTGVVVGVQEAYDVTTTAGDMAGDLVKVKATLATPAQAADMTLEYFETATSTWMPLTFDANGVLLFGPATGFPLANATSNFRVTYNAAGAYTTTLEIVDAATGVALVPGVTESVTVTAPVVNPTIASDLDSRAGVLTTVEEEFEVTTTAGTFAGQNILVKMTLTTPAQAADMAVQYFETATSTWMPLTFDASGVLTFGPATGFPLANATSDFKVTFSAAGTYAYTLEIVDAATPATILASASESVTVTAFEVPTIVSDLNNRANVLTRREENFLIATTAGDNAGEMVKIKIALTDAAQRDDIDLSYQDGTGNFVPVAFDVNGELLIGPAAGFALADDTVNFKIAFNATGIYEYTLAIVDAVSGVVLGDTVVESVTIIVNGVKEDALTRAISLYPNPASDMLNITLATVAKAEVTVMDLTGKQVAEVKAVAGAASLNVANLKAGSYLLRVKTAEGIAHKRFVVVR